MIHHSTYSDDYLRYLSLRGKRKRRKKLKQTRIQNSSLYFQWLEQIF